MEVEPDRLLVELFAVLMPVDRLVDNVLTELLVELRPCSRLSRSN
ncbi:hypothetical protein [Caballeronia sp. GACF4]|nr:hypothetical protein [Caballeronia sp. GACF4]